MRFVVTGEWKRNAHLRLVLLMYLVFVALFWLTSGALYFSKMSLDPASVSAYFLGDPNNEFGQPARPITSLIETSHMHLFAMGMLIMVLTHLLLFIPLGRRKKVALIACTYLSTLGSEASNWLVRVVSPSFAWLKIVSFLLMEASLLVVIVLLAYYAAMPGKNAYRDGETA